MAGGTGGHILPALAVARLLRARGIHVLWLGSRGGMEARMVPESGFELAAVEIGGVRGKGLGTRLAAPWRLLKAVIQSMTIMRAHRPRLVLGFGGFVAGPGGLAARALGIPLVIHEQNAIAGLTNRVLARMANRVLAGYPGAFAEGAEVIGNPVRPDIADLPGPDERMAGRGGPMRLLVVGGSLGARALNELIPQALARIPAEQRPRITHQTGMANLESVKADYVKAGLNPASDVELLPFINNMAQRLAECDVILCRAGAITVSELCAAGVASLLVPLVVSTTAHQRDNAIYMAER
ncbi:MAG: undecaprenyldiphospho-muramoylpentapeptide beta-N-acetylglucosaminyltransferase, partial [Sphingomonadales bacterium]|nr:undecaprenyldiphospho-muramoylpentapeptide beta-N-acetylglucosaminyltransferase [Sphingomonadales bacterium]